jgi:hypothetical protein
MDHEQDMNTNRIQIGAQTAAGILTVFVLTAYSTQHAFAQTKPTTLEFSGIVDKHGWPTVDFEGHLTSEGSGVGGADITITKTDRFSIPLAAHATTDEHGFIYSIDYPSAYP